MYYDSNARISANFLNWVVQTYDRDIIRKLNATAREGRYTEEMWTTLTGHGLEELNEAWKLSLE